MKHLWGREGQRLKYPFREGQQAKLQRQDARGLWRGQRSGLRAVRGDARRPRLGTAGLRAAVEPCQHRSCLAGVVRRCRAVGVWWCWGARSGGSALGQARAGGCCCWNFQADDYFMESSEVQSYVCLLSAVTLSLFNVVLTAACFYKSK